VFRSVEALLRPRTVAIVGASDTGGAGWPRAIYQNLQHAGFPARVFLINPRRRELWGQPVYPDFAALPEPIDLALVVIPAEAVVETLAEAARRGVRAALVFAARFGEGGDAAGARRAAELAALVERTGLRVSGPNCMGCVSLRENLLFYPATRVRGLPAGPVGVVFQSGGTFQYWLQQGAVRGLGYSYAVSSGNELDLDMADYVNFLVEDEVTRVVVCLIEGIRRPAAFMAAAEKALAAGKPVLAVKVGRSERGRAAIQSHTGALAGDDQVFDAMCRRLGIVRCASLDDLIEGALAFQHGRVPRGRGVAMAGYSGGAKGLFLDYAAAEGLQFAELQPATIARLTPLLDPGLAPDNPLDTGAGLAGQPGKFAEICRIMATDPGVDVLSMQGQLPLDADEPRHPEAFASVAAAEAAVVVAHGRMGQNVTEAGRAFQRAAGVPFLQGLPETVRAIKALVDYGERRRRGIPVVPPPQGRPADLDGPVLERQLRNHALPPPRGALAPSPEVAGVRAAELGFPVALKIVSPHAVHKTEVGGVALGLAGAATVATEAAAMQARLRARVPAARIDGFLVQQMVSGLEIILGARDDPQYGPFLIVGLGGIQAEALRDVSCRLLPVAAEEAREMLGELRGRALLGPFRGRPARDVEALIAAIEGLSALYLDHRDHLTDLEINPLVVLEEGQGVRAVDVRLVHRAPSN
jgi:acetyltransferase